MGKVNDYLGHLWLCEILSKIHRIIKALSEIRISIRFLDFFKQYVLGFWRHEPDYIQF